MLMNNIKHLLVFVKYRNIFILVPCYCRYVFMKGLVLFLHTTWISLTGKQLTCLRYKVLVSFVLVNVGNVMQIAFDYL